MPRIPFAGPDLLPKISDAITKMLSPEELRQQYPLLMTNMHNPLYNVVGGFCLGSLAFGVGGAVGTFLYGITGRQLPLKVTTLLGSVGASAAFVHYVNPQLALAQKIGVATASILWPTLFGSHSGKQGPGISENRMRRWETIALLCGFTAVTCGTYLGNPALGVFVGGIASNLLAQIGGKPEGHPGEVVRNLITDLDEEPHFLQEQRVQ